MLKVSNRQFESLVREQNTLLEKQGTAMVHLIKHTRDLETSCKILTVFNEALQRSRDDLVREVEVLQAENNMLKDTAAPSP